MAIPTLTPEQRAEALAKGTAARKARAEVKDRLERGASTLPASWPRPPVTARSAR